MSEAKLFDIEVKIPSISLFNKTFGVYKNNVYFGIKDIKSLTGVNGDKVIKAISETCAEIKKKPKNFNWMDVLIHLSPINATAFKALCSVGFFSTKSIGVTRNKALYEYLIFKNLTKAELKWLTTNYPVQKWDNLYDAFKALFYKERGGGTSKVDRKQVIENELFL